VSAGKKSRWEREIEAAEAAVDPALLQVDWNEVAASGARYDVHEPVISPQALFRR